MVRRNSGYDFEDSHVEYHTNPKEIAKYVSKEKAIALMTLGECLRQVEEKIIEEHVRENQNGHMMVYGWHSDDDNG
jgi:hypothetical protein